MKLKKQFKDFYDEICIHEESEDLKEKRDTLQKDIEDKFPSEMKDHGIELKKVTSRSLIREAINIVQQLNLQLLIEMLLL